MDTIDLEQNIGMELERIKSRKDTDSNSRLDKLERLLELELKQKSFLCPSGSISKELCNYAVQIGFSSVILGFSIYNLLKTDQYHDLSVSLISMLIGIYIPSPNSQINRDD